MVTEFLVLLTLGSVVALASVLLARHKDRSQRISNRQAFGVSFARGITPDAVESFVRSLTGLQLPWWRRVISTPTLVIEVHATHDDINFRILVERGAAEFVIGQLRGAIPGVRIADDQTKPFESSLAAELRLLGGERQLSVGNPAEMSSAILSALRPLGRGEQALISGSSALPQPAISLATGPASPGYC